MFCINNCIIRITKFYKLIFTCFFMLSESEKDKIRIEAKNILEKFGKALEKVEVKQAKKEKKVGGYRMEKEASTSSNDFRKRFFENAPKIESDFIIAEKGNW